MNILITGGAGYIGSVICREALRRGHRVRVADALWFDEAVPGSFSAYDGYEFRRVDICEDIPADLLEGIDFVVHAAAVVGEPASKLYPDLTLKVNNDGSKTLIDMLKHAHIRGLLFMSTCSNYGVASGLANEEAELQPLSLYARTKVDLERYLMERVDWVDWTILRLSTVYGVSPRMRFDLTVNDFTLKALVEKELKIFLPYTYRPYIHVADVAKVITSFIEQFDQVKNEVFNIGFKGENHQKMHIAESIKRFLPEFKIVADNKCADLRDYKVDFSKLKKRLNLEHTVSLDGGIREIINFIKSGVVTDWRNPKYYNTSPNIANLKRGNAWKRPVLKN